MSSQLPRQTKTNMLNAMRLTKQYYTISPHQTTTRRRTAHSSPSCVISFLYIKPQLPRVHPVKSAGCIISCLYIKPQLHVVCQRREDVVLYRFSTSNHNQVFRTMLTERLYHIVSLHQTTTGLQPHGESRGCIISFLYIKPQHTSYTMLSDLSCIISFLYIKPQLHPIFRPNCSVVLYRFSTSNHNS